MSSNYKEIIGFATGCIIILYEHVCMHKWMDYFTEEDEN